MPKSFVKKRIDHPLYLATLMNKQNGQATKARNGIRSTSKHPNGVKNALEYLVHAHTPFLNNQEFLRDYLVYHRDNTDYMKHVVSCICITVQTILRQIIRTG